MVNLRFSIQGVIMKILSLLLILMTFSLYNCSSSDVEKEKSEKALVSEVEQSLEDKSSAEAVPEDVLFDDKTTTEATKESTAESPVVAAAPEVKEETPVAPEVTEKVQISETGEYMVEKGDTLLLISFKVYGDYRKWRQILAENPNISKDNLKVGLKIKYTPPADSFEWKKRGNPHLILKGETLGKISNKYYGTIKRWREIFDNNQPMILDPNLIFAGFTLYYMPDKLAQID